MMHVLNYAMHNDVLHLHVSLNFFCMGACCLITSIFQYLLYIIYVTMHNVILWLSSSVANI